MANRSGAKGNKGGSSARKKGLSIDFSEFGEIMEEFDNFGEDIGKIIAEVLENTADTVAVDTEKAVAPANLPAKGNWSDKETVASIAFDEKAEIKGTTVEINLGFDKTKPGAGGFLITGTPKMQPDKALEKIYAKKSYENTLKKDIAKYLIEKLEERIG